MLRRQEVKFFTSPRASLGKYGPNRREEKKRRKEYSRSLRSSREEEGKLSSPLLGRAWGRGGGGDGEKVWGMKFFFFLVVVFLEFLQSLFHCTP